MYLSETTLRLLVCTAVESYVWVSDPEMVKGLVKSAAPVTTETHLDAGGGVA